MQAQFSDLPLIPAMTTDAERQCYYRLAKEGASKGAVVELGAWLGASSAYLAAAMRDSGVDAKVHVYDRFVSKPGHIEKVKAFYAKKGIDEAPVGPCVEQFQHNLGPLMDHVEVHQGEIAKIEWAGSPISVLITDAPKRVPEISAVLTRLRVPLQPGSVMAWQDFCHFPSYEIPACLYRLRGHIEFVEAVVPGTTLVFKVAEAWREREVSREALALDRWTLGEIHSAWTYWLNEYVPAEKASLFRCGAAMFLCDIGKPNDAVEVLRQIYSDNAPAILPKWRYLHRVRNNFHARYAPLFDFLAKQGAFEPETA